MTAALFFAIGVVVGFVVGFAVAGGFSTAPAPTSNKTVTNRPAPVPVPVTRTPDPSPQVTGPDQDALKGSAVLDDILAKDPISEEEELFQNLRLKCLYDDSAVERLIEREKETDPNGSRLELMKSARIRWERENA